MSKLLEKCVGRFEKAVDADPELKEICRLLSLPHEVIERELTIQRDDGRKQYARSWRCRYNNLKGPTKGGVKFAPSATSDDVSRLALLMTLKYALLDLPFGGANGAVGIETSDLTAKERYQIAETYSEVFSDILKPDHDIAAADMATSSCEMEAVVGGLKGHRPAKEKANGHSNGKSEDSGGVAIRSGTAGHGAVLILNLLSEDIGISLDGARIAMQGIGEEGSEFARRAVKAGARIVSIADSAGTITDPDGLDVDTILKSKTDGVADYDASPDAVISAEADILCLAAGSDALTESNATQVKARFVLELANAAISPDADTILQGREIKVGPDILFNSGSAVASYVDWQSLRSSNRKSRRELADEWRDRLETSAYALAATAEECEGDFRLAALLYALRDLNSIAHSQGLFEY